MGTIIGIVVGSGLLFYTIIHEGGFALFYDPNGLMIIFGGTAAAVLISFPLGRVVGVFGVMRNVFRQEIVDAGSYISAIVRLAHKARKESILSLNNDVKNINNRFLRMGLQLVIDGQPPELVRAVLETELESLLSRHEEGARIFKTMGKFAPAFGLVGCLMGLISMLRALSGGMEKLGPSMATALVATFYGVLLANLIFLPVAEKLTSRSEKEMLQIQIIIEGVLMVQEGLNPRLIEQRLNAHLEPDARSAHFDRILRREKSESSSAGAQAGE